MEMRFEYVDKVLVAHLQCYLDRSGAENFKYVLSERMKPGEKIVLDLEKLVNIDTYGLDALLAMAQKALAKEVENYACAMPEVRWFCDTYLESFKKTLDELE